MPAQLVTSDLQLADSQRDQYRLQFLATLQKLSKDHGVDEVLVLGDLTEAKDNHSARLVNIIVDGFAALARTVRVVILRGNHDGLTPDNPFFRFMGHIPNIVWFNKPTEYGGDLFLPHTLDHKKDWAKLPMDQAELIFAHNMFAGAVSESGHKLSGIPTSVFPKGATVISGDVHAPQTVGPVTYVGAPYLCDFGDDFKPRVLLITDNGIKSIPVHGPQKRLVDITWSSHQLPKHAGNPGDILKVRVQLEMDQRDKWSEIREAIHGWGHKNRYTIHAVQPIVNYKAGTKAKALNYAPKTDAQLLRDYAKRCGLDHKTEDAGLKLMEEGK